MSADPRYSLQSLLSKQMLCKGVFDAVRFLRFLWWKRCFRRKEFCIS